jgi:predicted DNA-binding transcriptional regulator YafY
MIVHKVLVARAYLSYYGAQYSLRVEGGFMAKSSSQKLKILYLAKMLLEETDDDHGLTMPQIIQRLAAQGINAERKSLYDDINLLRNFGLDIISRNSPKTEYAIGERDFQLPELLLLVDAVQNSRFLTEKKSQTLVESVKKLTSIHQAKLLSKHVHVEGRIKMQNESIYYNVDAIQEALRKKRRISFKYFQYNSRKERVYRHEELLYVENPVCLIYSSEYYYLVAYNDEQEFFKRYRLDRMTDINVLEDRIAQNTAISEFDASEFNMHSFGMFSGDKVSVDLLVDVSIIGAIIDRFSQDVRMKPVDDGCARVHVTVLKSEVFFGWLAQFGTLVKIEKPESLAREYKEFLEGICGGYG